MATFQRSTALVLPDERVRLDSRRATRSVRSTQKHWHPPEGLSPDDMKAVIDAAGCERDQLLLRVLWATGARISAALALRPMDVQRDHLVLPNRKNPNLTVKRVYLPAGQADLPGALLVWANAHGLSPQAPLFFSRKRGADGGVKAISRVQAWLGDTSRAVVAVAVAGTSRTRGCRAIARVRQIQIASRHRARADWLCV